MATNVIERLPLQIVILKILSSHNLRIVFKKIVLLRILQDHNYTSLMLLHIIDSQGDVVCITDDRDLRQIQMNGP